MCATLSKNEYASAAIAGMYNRYKQSLLKCRIVINEGE